MIWTCSLSKGVSARRSLGRSRQLAIPQRGSARKWGQRQQPLASVHGPSQDGIDIGAPDPLDAEHHSLKDVAAAGGWKDTETLLRCYQAPDSETLLAVMSEERKLREVLRG